ncbi:hypothetical protein MESS4_320016 [Mesorhizobium sp. STM 4661]|nr:hypothetical protein MESS4_320016 [Mesorhizobium sp. STM 4661]
MRFAVQRPSAVVKLFNRIMQLLHADKAIGTRRTRMPAGIALHPIGNAAWLAVLDEKGLPAEASPGIRFQKPAGVVTFQVKPAPKDRSYGSHHGLLALEAMSLSSSARAICFLARHDKLTCPDRARSPTWQFRLVSHHFDSSENCCLDFPALTPDFLAHQSAISKSGFASDRALNF